MLLLAAFLAAQFALYRFTPLTNGGALFKCVFALLIGFASYSYALVFNGVLSFAFFIGFCSSVFVIFHMFYWKRKNKAKKLARLSNLAVR